MALNKVTIQGNLCKDIEPQTAANGGLFCRNTIACQRNYAKEGTERQSDFISVLFYGKQAEFLQKYFSKGTQILIEGRIQTGSYDKEDGTKVYTTDVIAEHLYFCGNKKEITENISTVEGFKATMEKANVPFTIQQDDTLPF